MSGQQGVYDTTNYRKHKRPEDLTESPQELLETAVSHGDAVYNVSGIYAVRAFQHRPGTWHGHPIPWSRLPSEAVGQLIASGRLKSAAYRKALRKNLGQEFDR
jgi:hypothetical protein